MPHPNEIKKLHRTLASLVCKASGKSTVIRSESERPFSIKTGGRVHFELTYQNHYEAEIAHREMGGKGISHTVHVFPLLCSKQKPRNSDVRLEYWVSWYERWVKIKEHRLDLVTASWTLFRGMKRNEDKKQIIRADWDHLDSIEGNRDTGQPHWHVDYPILAATGSLAAVSVPRGLETETTITNLQGLALTRAGELRIGRVHLAMGTWKPHEEFPCCWQRSVQTCDDLGNWAEKTLLYLQGQFKNHSPG